MIAPTPQARYRLQAGLGLTLALVALAAVGGCGGTPATAPSLAERNRPPGTNTPPIFPASPADPSITASAKKPAIIGDRMAGVVATRANPTIPQEPSPFRFANIQPESGVDFQHVSGMNQDKHFPTANGSGLAILDYDGDGRMDLYFASYNLLPPGSPLTGRNRLYRNLGNGKFEDRTDASGLGYAGHCHGIIAADLDNDGDSDVVLCNYEGSRLYRNNGDGTFTDVSPSSGLSTTTWGSGGAPLDFDNDGDLDLYVSNYGEWKYPQDDQFCGDPERHIRFYCSPRQIRTVQHHLYRNNGNLNFTDATQEAGVARSPAQQGHGFGVVTADLNGDRKIDIYVANDMNANFLFLNKGDGTFDDTTELSGAAYDDKGNAQSGMGVDAEDINGDGRPELFVTNFANEYNTLYQNLGNGIFYDQTPFMGLAADSMPFVGWGCGLVDLDNDGWPDSFVANGHVDDNREGQEYGEVPLLHRNIAMGNMPDANRRFQIATRDVGPYFDETHVARGVAFGDLDDDGDLDIVVNHKDGKPGILRNDTPSAQGENHWIRLVLQGRQSNRDGVGAQVEVIAGDRTIHRQRKGGTSLESTSDPRLLIGIGKAAEATRVTVRWPSGAESVLDHVEAGKTQIVVEPEKSGDKVAATPGSAAPTAANAAPVAAP